MALAEQTFDAIVIGSGITGGWAAKELTEEGLKVLLLERGREVAHARDYASEHLAPWEVPFRGEGSAQEFARDYSIQRRNFLFSEYVQQYFVNDQEHPYLTPEEKPFQWFRGYQLGGRSLTWGRQCQRWGDLDFEANAKDGHGTDWPIRYRDLAPWYDRVEQFIGVSGNADGLPHMPDGQFLPPMEMNCIERHMKSRIEETYPDRKLIIGRVAVLTQPHLGRAACHYCGPCERGCSAGAYFCTQSSTLPAAQRTGNLTLLTDRVVERINHEPGERRVGSVDVINAGTRARERYTGRSFFLCASTLGTTQILLNSRSEAFPDGLANSSGVLGRYFMDHVMALSAVGRFTGHEDKYYYGHRPNSIFVPRFANISRGDTDFMRGYAYQGSGWRMGWRRGLASKSNGVELKNELRQPGAWIAALVAFGECLPRASNRVELDDRHPDPFGIPQIRIDFSFSDNESRMVQHAAEQAAAMIEASGGEVIRGGDAPFLPGSAIHEMGTARMGRDPRTSVLNGHNQCHDVPNVFVTDGASMASSSCQPPSLTYMALTARACNYAVGQMRAGAL